MALRMSLLHLFLCRDADFYICDFSQIPHSDADLAVPCLKTVSSDFNGAPRSMLQLWSIFRAFLVVALVTHIFFP